MRYYKDKNEQRKEENEHWKEKGENNVRRGKKNEEMERCIRSKGIKEQKRDGVED